MTPTIPDGEPGQVLQFRTRHEPSPPPRPEFEIGAQAMMELADAEKAWAEMFGPLEPGGRLADAIRAVGDL